MRERSEIERRLRRFVRENVLNRLHRLAARTICRNRVRLSWHFEQNWGDALNPLLVEMISGRKVFHTDDPQLDKFIVIGSIMSTADANTEVWGSGFITTDATLRAVPKRVHAVRGPLTRQMLLNAGVKCPPIFGDPALLLPRYWNPQADVQHEVGLVPHMVDADLPWVQKAVRREGVLLIDVKGDLRGFVQQIKSCKTILSSSLHGLICADAYGVPNHWIKLSDRLVGGQFKFDDYYLGIGQDPKRPIVVQPDSDVLALAAEATRNEVRADLDALLLACPFLSTASRAVITARSGNVPIAVEN